MLALLPTTSPWPVFDVAASRRIETRALVHSPDLMERAGLAVAKLALALRRGTGPVWIACTEAGRLRGRPGPTPR